MNENATGGKMFSGVSFKLPLFKNTCQSRIEVLKLKVDILCAYSQIYLFGIQYEYETQRNIVDCNFFPKLNNFKYALNA